MPYFALIITFYHVKIACYQYVRMQSNIYTIKESMQFWKRRLRPKCETYSISEPGGKPRVLNPYKTWSYVLNWVS